MRLRHRVRSALRITGVVIVLVFGVSHWQSYWSRHPTPTWAPYSLTSSRTPRIQHDFPESAGADVHRLQAVKEEFIHAYTGYKNHAWLRDEVKPLSGGSHTQYCGWALTLVDTLDTLYLMGMYDEFEEGVQAVTKMNFFFSSTIFCGINPFEMTIRHLGGLLSAYDISGARDDRLKNKAVQMGEMLLRAFGANGMHCRQIIWPRIPGWPCKPSSMLPLARLGSQSLEFIRLSMVSGRPTWADKIQFFAQEMERIQETSFLPGLWPKFVDGSCPKGLCDYDQTETQWFTMGSGTDSTYEYLPKTHLLYGARNPIYLRMWRRSLMVFRDHMIFQPMAVNNSDLLFPALLRSPNGDTHDFLGKIEHLSCFIGGTIALGARIDPSASSDLELDLAAKLTNACVWAYETSPTGIMPDTFWVLPCPDSPTNCPWNPTVFEDKVVQSHPHPTANTTIPLGFAQIDDPKYMLRPEAIESVFMLYRITGHQRWREKGWRMFQSIRKATRTRLAHAGLSDTLTPGAAKVDKMESFWLSETLKYFYLLFADPRVLSLDEWVFNTEAHPFKLQDDSRGFG